MRLRATVGEVSDALEKVCGRHRADTQKVTGVYAAAYDSAEGWEQLQARDRRLRRGAGPPAARDDRQARPGRPRPRRQGGRHAPSPTSASTSTSARCSRPPRSARARRSRTTCTRSASVTLAAGHKTLVPAIIEALKAQGADDIIVFVGGVIPRQDYDFLYDAGVKGIYGPGTPIPASAKDVLEQIRAGGRRALNGRRDDGPTRCRPPTRPCVDDVAGGPASAAPRDRQGDHAARIDAAPTIARRADALLTALLPRRAGAAPRHLGRARRRQVDLHRDAGPRR